MRGLLKRSVAAIARSAAFAKFVTLLEQSAGERPNLLRVLTFHRVGRLEESPALDPSLISATPQEFLEQMEYLATHYRVVSIPELLDARRAGKPLPTRSVMLTFDDAYQDFADNAWPILKSLSLPVTLFVPTAFPDHPERTFWWDRLHQAVQWSSRRSDLVTPIGRLSLATNGQRNRALRRLKNYVKALPHHRAMSCITSTCRQLGCHRAPHSVIGWDALRILASEGVTLGAHSQTHPMMNRISRTEALAEAVGSLRDLEREIGSVLPIFAYPGGALNSPLTGLLKREGVAVAFTTLRGINDMHVADPLRLRRINVGRLTTPAVLRVQLLPKSLSLNRWADQAL